MFSQPDDVTGGLIWRRYQLFSAADNSIAKETEGSPEEKMRIQTEFGQNSVSSPPALKRTDALYNFNIDSFWWVLGKSISSIAVTAGIITNASATIVHWWWLWGEGRRPRLISNLHTHHTFWYSSNWNDQLRCYSLPTHQNLLLNWIPLAHGNIWFLGNIKTTLPHETWILSVFTVCDARHW